MGAHHVKGKHRPEARGRRPRSRICLRKGCKRKYQPRSWNQRVLPGAGMPAASPPLAGGAAAAGQSPPGRRCQSPARAGSTRSAASGPSPRPRPFNTQRFRRRVGKASSKPLCDRTRAGGRRGRADPSLLPIDATERAGGTSAGFGVGSSLGGTGSRTGGLRNCRPDRGSFLGAFLGTSSRARTE